MDLMQTQSRLLNGLRWTGLASALVAGALLASSAPAHAAAFTPASPSVTAGLPFTVSLLDTISAADGIAALDLEVDFNPAVFSFVSALDGLLLPGWAITSGSHAGVALISASEPPTATSDANGTGSVVALNFLVAPGAPTGSSKVTVVTTSTAVGVESEYQLSPTSFTASVQGASVPVPAPGLSCLALPALLMLRRRRR